MEAQKFAYQEVCDIYIVDDKTVENCLVLSVKTFPPVHVVDDLVELCMDDRQVHLALINVITISQVIKSNITLPCVAIKQQLAQCKSELFFICTKYEHI